VPDGRTILVIEDNEQNLELVEFLLEEAGWAVRRAMDPEAARRQLALAKPDLILMDMDLPGTDGLTLVAEFRRDAATAAVPIVALTAHAMRGDRERFLNGGCDGYIAKPIDVNTFVRDVRRILRP
jgi:two-component system, cell cycle response regulator DivK